MSVLTQWVPAAKEKPSLDTEVLTISAHGTEQMLLWSGYVNGWARRERLTASTARIVPVYYDVLFWREVPPA